MEILTKELLMAWIPKAFGYLAFSDFNRNDHINMV